jgi:hypothetical protein
MARVRNTFTDLEAAREEAYFLKGSDGGATYALVNIGGGEIWVTRKVYAKKMGCEIMWDTAKNAGRVLVDRRFWNDEHKAVVVSLYGKLGPQVIADKTGRTKNSVVKMAQKLGVKYSALAV